MAGLKSQVIRKDDNGYLRVHSDNADGYKMAHRIVMEKNIGRSLRKDEIVHHKNRIRDDNRIENLEIVSRQQHSQIHWESGDYGFLPKGIIECPGCGNTRKHQSRGLCASCVSIRWKNANKEKFREIHRKSSEKYRKKNIEVCRKRCLAATKAYYWKNREKVLAKQKERRLANLEKAREQCNRSKRKSRAKAKERKRQQQIKAKCHENLVQSTFWEM